jgi:hypothetical protein
MLLLALLERLALRARRSSIRSVGTGLWITVFLLRSYQKRTARRSVVLREELRPGEALLITHEP